MDKLEKLENVLEKTRNGLSTDRLSPLSESLVEDSEDRRREEVDPNAKE